MASFEGSWLREGTPSNSHDKVDKLLQDSKVGILKVVGLNISAFIIKSRNYESSFPVFGNGLLFSCFLYFSNYSWMLFRGLALREVKKANQKWLESYFCL